MTLIDTAEMYGEGGDAYCLVKFQQRSPNLPSRVILGNQLYFFAPLP